MPNIKEIMVEAILPAFKAVGKVEMKNVLSGIKQHNTSEIYRNTLQGLYSDFTLLKDTASKTRTGIDDGIVDMVLESVKETADADSIVLS